MIASSERPGMIVVTFVSCTRPRSARVSVHVSSSGVRPSVLIDCPYQRVASTAPSDPGIRDGYSVDKEFASVVAAAPSNKGSRVDRGRVPVVDIENRKA